MSEKYQIMKVTSTPIKNILNTYDDIFNGKYSLKDMSNVLSDTSAYYSEIVNYADEWIKYQIEITNIPPLTSATTAKRI